MSLAGMLNVTVDILTPGSQTKDAYGAWTDTITTVSSRAAVQIDTSQESMAFERQTKKRTFNVYMPNTATVPVNARLKVTSGEYTGTLIDSNPAKADHAGRSTYWMLRGTEVL